MTPSSDRFSIGEILGEGTMGRVHRAFDRWMGCDVALKTLQKFGPAQIVWLKREFRVLSGISHPNLVELYNLVVDGRESFFTMELVDGCGFLDHVRAGAGAADIGLDEHGVSRLRSALAQLSAGLAALHGAGRLHCDVKPANVSVTSSGRVVLLDFGLSASLQPAETKGNAKGLFGTVAYMSPEQAWGEPLTPASDWYSVGVILYEALTGRLPIDGTPGAVLAAKKGRLPVAPSKLAPRIPADLEELVVSLLNPDPAQRVWSEALGSAKKSHATAVATPGSAFVGRSAELAILRGAHDRVRRGTSELVRVRGPSGMGKTALVREFVDRTESEAACTTLHGRCHRNEGLAYRGLDGVVDDLVRHVSSLPDSDARALIPSNVSALARFFPALTAVRGWEARAQENDESSPAELRRRALAALDQIVTAVSASRPIVIWIDDLHWVDSDGAGLLMDWLESRAKGAVLILLSYREEGTEPELLRRLQGAFPGAADDLLLGPLSDAEVRDLADRGQTLQASTIDQSLAMIVEGAGGSPFLARELSRWISAQGEGGTLPDGDVVRARVEAVSPEARRLLEVLSVASRPLSRRVAIAAAGPGEDLQPVIPRLRHEQLVRGTSMEGGLLLEPSHDRIRRSVVDSLPEPRKADVHRRLADALDKEPDTSPDDLLEHLLGAGEKARARACALLVADRAVEMLAFNRAARNYRLARQLGESSWNVAEKLARALASAGQAADSADAYEIAVATLSEAEPRHHALTALQRNAAEQRLRGGDVHRGVAALRTVLSASGVSYPETTAGAIGTILLLRGSMAVRGFLSRPPSGEPTVDELAQLDACWSAGLGLNMIDILRSAVFQARHAYLALRTGEPRHLLRALSCELTFTACEGGAAKRARVQILRQRANDMAAERADPELSALIQLSHGVAHYFGGAFSAALPHFDVAEQEFKRRQEGLTWEITNCRMYRVWALAWLGRLRELASILPGYVEEARTERNVIALAGLASAHSNVHWLAADELTQAIALSDEAVVSFPATSFQSPHYFELIAMTRAELYRGAARSAFSRVQAAWPKLKAIQFLRMQFFRVELRYLRALAALSAAWQSRQRERDACLEAARSEARNLTREDLPSARPLALLLRAGIEGLEGRESAAREQMMIAADAARELGMELHCSSAELIAGGTTGAEWMSQMGVRRPRQLAAAFVPAIAAAESTT